MAVKKKIVVEENPTLERDSFSNAILNVDRAAYCAAVRRKKHIRQQENKIEIQTRHDCDDFMSNNYIEKIQSIHEDKKKKSGEVSLIIHFQPTKLDFHTKKEYRMGKYNEKRNSMFLSLCQTNITKSIFEYKHGEMYKAAKEVIFIDEDYVKLIAHGNNTLTRINPNEQEL
jgi:hypothetical protein